MIPAALAPTGMRAGCQGEHHAAAREINETPTSIPSLRGSILMSVGMSTRLSSEARVQTAVAARYLGQLCKHFQHKLPVTLEEQHGRIDFSAGTCELDAAVNAGALTMRVTAGDETALATLEDVITRHLKRFAFREEPEVWWIRAA
jgi:hypothetical protein